MNAIRAIHIVVIAIGLLAQSAIAEEVTFKSETIQVVASLIERHLAQPTLNDELSRKWLRAFLDRLDPRRLYFRDSDFQEFREFEDRLDDLAKADDFDFPKRVLKRYRTRVKEALSHVENILMVKHDYTLDEECPLRFDSYAAKDEDLQERWRLSLKAELLMERLHGREIADVQSQLLGRSQRIARQADQMTDERLCEIYLDSLAGTLDPNSAYWSPTLESSLRGSRFEPPEFRLGLGMKQRAGKFFIVYVDPTRGSTAENRLMGWNVIAISRVDGETFDLTEMHHEDLSTFTRNSHGALERDTEIILELMNPITRERVTMSWMRILEPN